MSQTAATAVIKSLRDAGHSAFIVGGAVRDIVIGREPHDFDVATSATPDQVVALFGHTVPTGIKHGTVTVLDAGEPIEVTTFRLDQGCADGRHPDHVEFVTTVDADMSRRDFTMNALALDPLTGEIVDPFGGRADIAARVIRAVGDPAQRFAEDGLRCLRAVRFAAVLGFDIEPATFAAIRGALDVFRKVSAERVRDELIKLLAAPSPSHGLRLLAATGLLPDVLAELVPAIGCTQNSHHAFDVWDHTLAVVDAAPVALRVVALLHDVGKPAVCKPHDRKPGENTFIDHEDVGAEIADAVLRRLKFSNEDRERVVHLIKHHTVLLAAKDATPKALRRIVVKVGSENLDDLFAFGAADVIGKGFGEDAAARLAPIRAAVDAACAVPVVEKRDALAIGGAEVMAALGCGPGPRVGAVLKALQARVIDDPALNTADALCALIAEVA